MVIFSLTILQNFQIICKIFLKMCSSLINHIIFIHKITIELGIFWAFNYAKSTFAGNLFLWNSNLQGQNNLPVHATLDNFTPCFIYSHGKTDKTVKTIWTIDKTEIIVIKLLIFSFRTWLITNKWSISYTNCPFLSE